jgi:hypothetical protein
MTSLNLEDPIAVMLAATQAFEQASLDGLVYGGIALAMFGEPRETRDADLAVAGVSAASAQTALSSLGVTVVIAFEDIRFGGLSISRLSLLGGGKLNTVDLVTPLSRRYAALLMPRAMRGNLDGQPLRVVSPEDFILMKVLSTRERDLEDARTVITSLKGRLDESLLDAEAELLAGEIPDHEVTRRYRSVC